MIVDATSVQHAYPSIPSMTFATETQAKEQWKYVLDTMNFDPKKDVFQLRAAIAPFLKLGVPKSIKTKVWAFFIRFHRSEFGLEEHKVREGKFHELLQQLTPNHDAIVTDLARTYPHIPFFEKSIAQGGLGQMALFNVLKAYTLADPEVGYCQGFGFIAGVLLLHVSFFLLRWLRCRRNRRLIPCLAVDGRGDRLRDVSRHPGGVWTSSVLPEGHRPQGETRKCVDSLFITIFLVPSSNSSNSIVCCWM